MAGFFFFSERWRHRVDYIRNYNLCLPRVTKWKTCVIHEGAKPERVLEQGLNLNADVHNHAFVVVPLPTPLPPLHYCIIKGLKKYPQHTTNNFPLVHAVQRRTLLKQVKLLLKWYNT